MSIYKGTNPIHDKKALIPNQVPKAPPSHEGLGFNTCILVEHKHAVKANPLLVVLPFLFYFSVSSQWFLGSISYYTLLYINHVQDLLLGKPKLL